MCTEIISFGVYEGLIDWRYINIYNFSVNPPKILGVLKIMIVERPAVSTQEPVSITPVISLASNAPTATTASTAPATDERLTSSLVMSPRRSEELYGGHRTGLLLPVEPKLDGDIWYHTGDSAGFSGFEIVGDGRWNKILSHGKGNVISTGRGKGENTKFSVASGENDDPKVLLSARNNIVNMRPNAGTADIFAGKGMRNAIVDNGGETGTVNLGLEDGLEDADVTVETDGVIGRGSESNVVLKEGDPSWGTAYVHVWKNEQGEVVKVDEVSVHGENDRLLADYKTDTSFDGVFTGVRDIESAPTKKGSKKTSWFAKASDPETKTKTREIKGKSINSGKDGIGAVEKDLTKTGFAKTITA